MLVGEERGKRPNRTYGTYEVKSADVRIASRVAGGSLFDLFDLFDPFVLFVLFVHSVVACFFPIVRGKPIVNSCQPAVEQFPRCRIYAPSSKDVDHRRVALCGRHSGSC
jgi:hypothetical protein